MIAVLIAFLLGLILPITFGYSIADLFKSDTKTAAITIGKFDIQGLDDIDIKLGEYLVVIMGTDCAHCQDAVFDLNVLVDLENMPEIVALCPNEDDQISTFKNDFKPLFQIGKINENDFWNLLETSNIPRILLVKDGLIKQVWNDNVPSPNDIMASLK